MVTEAKQVQFNFTILREGLKAIASESKEQLLLNNHALDHLEDVFDPMPMDYLPSIEEENAISRSFASQMRELYRQINQSIGHLEWQKQEAFISQNNRELQQWRQIAQSLFFELNGSCRAWG